MESIISGANVAALKGEAAAGYSFAISDSIKNIPPSVWNEQIPGANLLMQYDYLKLVEDTQNGNVGFRYVLVKKDNAIKGVLYFQTVLFTGSDLLNYFPKNPSKWWKYLLLILKAICKLVFSAIRARILVSGNIFMTGESGVYFVPEIHLETRSVLFREAINEIAKADKKIKAVVVPDLYEPKTGFDIGFKEEGYCTMLLEPDMSIKIRDEWKSFDDYLGSFSSKYRVRAKKVYLESNESGITRREFGEEEIEKYEDTLYNLYLKVMRKADFKLAVFTKQYFREQKKQLPESYRFFAYFRGGEMIGFITSFLIGNKMDVHYIGMDNEQNKESHLYQRMMYDMIEAGILSRAERMHFGRTAPEIKSTVGASPMATYGYIRHVSPVLNFLVMRPFTSFLKPKEYVFRNPFKQ